jgi:hypothetical protein
LTCIVVLNLISGVVVAAVFIDLAVFLLSSYLAVLQYGGEHSASPLGGEGRDAMRSRFWATEEEETEEEE